MLTRGNNSEFQAQSESYDYDYHEYYSEEEATYPKETQVFVHSNHNVLLHGNHNVLVAEGTIGYGWGKSLSIILDSPASGRWFAAIGLLEEKEEVGHPLRLKVSYHLHMAVW